MSEKSFRDKGIALAKKLYIKSCVLTRNIHIRKVPVLAEKSNKRILFFATDNSKISGAFLCLVSLCDILMNKHGLDVFVILPFVGDGKPLLDAKNIPNYIINSFGWTMEISRKRDSELSQEIHDKKLINEGAIKKIKEFIEVNDVDLVHINSSFSYIGAIGALEEDIPLVWHIREMMEEGQNITMWNRNEGNELINKSTKVITVSDSIHDKYSKFIDSDKLVTIYDGVEVERFYNPQKKILNGDSIKFIFIGNVAEYKGIYDFSDACIKLFKNGFKDFEVWIVGSGEDMDIGKVKDSFTKAKMDDKVTFFGYQKDVVPYLKQSDVFCMCTRFEAFGRTTVEAMMAGNLAIGANTGGTKDLIEDGKTGLLYSQGSANDLYEKMKWVIENKSESQEIAKSGQEYMVKNMSSERNADEIYELYQEILG